MIHLIDRLTPQLFKLDASLHIHNSSTDPSLTRLLLRCPFICPPYTPALHPSFLVHPSTVSSVFFPFLFIIVIPPAHLFARCCLLALLSFVSFSFVRFRLKPPPPNQTDQRNRCDQPTPRDTFSFAVVHAPHPSPTAFFNCLSVSGGHFFVLLLGIGHGLHKHHPKHTYETDNTCKTPLICPKEKKEDLLLCFFVVLSWSP